MRRHLAAVANALLLLLIASGAAVAQDQLLESARATFKPIPEMPPAVPGVEATADRIELWSIERLRPYERNPRTHSEAQVDQIAASMVEFGWTNPIPPRQPFGIVPHGGRSLISIKVARRDRCHQAMLCA